MPQIFRQSDKGSIHHLFSHQSAIRYYPQSLPGYPVFYDLQTWQLPKPALPESRRRLKAYKRGNLFPSFSHSKPSPLLQKSPAPENRWTSPRPGYASYPDAPANTSQFYAMFSNLPPENIRGLPMRNTTQAPYGLWTIQTGPCPPF